MAIPLQTKPALNDADNNGIHDLLYSNVDYVRRIHWWVRLFGFVWIVLPALFVVGAVVFMIASAALYG